MGILDSNPLNVRVVEDSIPSLLNKITDTSDLRLYQYKRSENDRKVLGAVLRDISVFFKSNAVFISTNGVDGETTEVELNSTNFPNLIENSTIKEVMLLPFTRRTSSTGTLTYRGKEWRLCVFTSNGQIYHNFPARANGYDGAEQEGDEYRFDESVIWDLPNRITPVKTNTGDDATLIATGKYRYIPCYQESFYEFHPALNQNNGYGNTEGFGAVREFTDYFSNETQRCARFFFPERENEEMNPFVWLSGNVVNDQLAMIGTYQSASGSGRRCVFASSDGGREWFVRYEFGAKGSTKRMVNDALSTAGPSNAFSTDVTAWGTNSVGSGVYNVIKRFQYIPSTDNKNPDHKFIYEEPIAVAGIESTSSAITVETASAHGLTNGDVVLFTKQDSTFNSWDWIISIGYTQDEAGDGNIWKAQVVDSTHFILRMEIHNPNNELYCGHIHTLNFCKDGVIIGSGEEYPSGWVLYMLIRHSDSFSNMFAGNLYPVYRLTNTEKSVQRILGMELYHDGSWICGMDTSNLDAASITLPNGAIMKRNSTGIYTGSINDIDDFANCTCVFETRDPAYFFKNIFGNLIFVGQRGSFAISKDKGETWKEYKLPNNLWSVCQLIGISTDNIAYIKYMGISDTLAIPLS